MTALLLALSHVGAFVLGAVMWHAIAIREGRALRNEEKPKTHHRRGPTPGALVLIILVASLMLAGFGVQQAEFQDQMNRRAACNEAWGDKMVQAAKTGRTALRSLSRAERERDDAVDAVLLFVTANSSVREPSEEILRQYKRVLGNFAEAKAHLDKVRRETKQTQSDNPFPRLEC